MKKLSLAVLTLASSALIVAPRVQAQSKVKPVSVVKAIISTSDNVNGPAKTTFKTSDTKLYCLVKLNRVGTANASTSWIAVDAAGQHNIKFLVTKLPKQLGDTLHFVATKASPWPTGKYRADIYVNGKLVRSLPYSVVN